MSFENKVIAQFRCLEDNITLTQIGENLFSVNSNQIGPIDKGGWAKLKIETDHGLDLRGARIVFEKQVNLAICRMTLDRLYVRTGIERPKGEGKYGLPA